MSQSICSTGLRWLWLVVVVLIIDLGSKYLILQNFALGDTVPLFPSLNLHYARNYGAAFSFLADSGGWQRWFFAGIAIGISVILAVMMYQRPPRYQRAYPLKRCPRCWDTPISKLRKSTPASPTATSSYSVPPAAVNPS